MSTIYYNGTILTMAEKDGATALRQAPEAIMVRDGVIVGIGTLDELQSLAGEDLQLKDLQGGCLLPGFIDGHSHISMNGQMATLANLGDCTCWQDVIDVLKQYIKDRHIGADNAIMGFGYDHNFLDEQAHPDKRVLDKVSTEIPIMIMHVSGHLACVNSKALEISGITADTPNPQGGVIGRMADGKEPSGYLEEAGMVQAQIGVGSRIKPDIAAIMAGMQANYIQNGITTVQDGATVEQDWQLLQGMSRAGQLQIDVVSYPLMSENGQKLSQDNFTQIGTYVNHLKIGGYKLVLDGSPQGRSAWMSEPYVGENSDYCGYPWMSDEQVEMYARIAVEEGRQLLAHCNGDNASEQFLRCYEKAVKETGNKENLRPVMVHCQTVRNDQLDRMANMNMIASIFVGHVFYWGDIHMKNFGERRGNHISPVQDALDRDITVTFHQDTPVTKPDMMHTVWTAVNRISRSGQTIGANQKIDVYEALKAITINGAYQYHEEDSKGTLEIGKRADMVVLDCCPLTVDPMEIRDIAVLQTIKDGKCIYCKE